MSSSGLIERQAIGRSGTIGSLYDIRTDQFVMGNLFNEALSSPFIRTSDCASVSYWLDFHNSQKETLDNLNIEASLKIGVMSGLLKLEGSAKYLKQTKTDSNIVRVTFIYKAKTKQEDLQVSAKGLHEYFSYYAFENPDVTHVVVGIQWGANVAATFERTVEKRDEVERIEGALGATLTKPMFSVSGEAKVDYDKQQKTDLESLKISFSGDVLIEDCPQTIDQVMKIYRSVPSLIKSLNDGKGKQLTYTLCSLKQIADMTKFERNITRLVKEVSTSIVNRIETIFEQLNDERRKLNDFLDDIKPWKELIHHEWFDLIKEKLSDFNEKELELKRQLSDLLVKIRNGTVEESKMIELIDYFNQHPCSPKSIEKFFDENKRIKTKIKTLIRISPEKKELLTDIDSIEDFILDFYDNDVYLLHICEQWQKNDEENLLKQMRYFINLKKTKQDTLDEKAKFWVIDYDLHSHLKNRPTNSVIYYVTRALIKSKDFYKDSLKKLSRQEIERILNENSNLTEQNLMDRYKKFMDEYPDGELSDDNFIHEFRKIFQNGNPENFCDFAFATIDKDKSGKIGFSEFMTTIALTHSGNLDTRLHLVFSVCDYDHVGTIGNRKIIKFIEIIAELNNGLSSVNTSAAKSVAEQIMKIYNKNKDGTVTEEEFINCCKRDPKITMAFLPDLNIKWKQEGMTIAGENGEGNQLNQLHAPFGIFIDADQNIHIADCYNHRIVEWKSNAKNGQIVAGGNGEGDETNQLNYPADVIIDKGTKSLIISDFYNRRVMRWSLENNEKNGEISIKDIDCCGLIMDKNSSLYVSDFKKNEVRRWKKGEKNGTIVAGGNGEGNQLNQLSLPTYIFVDEDYSLYVSDKNNHRVMKWLKDAKEGIIVAGGNGQGNSLAQLSSPTGVIVDQLGQIYVADYGNHRVMCWCKGAQEGTIVVGGNGEGEQSYQLYYPQGLSFDRQGNLYVADCKNHRIQKFEINQNEEEFVELNKNLI